MSPDHHSRMRILWSHELFVTKETAAIYTMNFILYFAMMAHHHHNNRRRNKLKQARKKESKKKKRGSRIPGSKSYMWFGFARYP